MALIGDVIDDECKYCDDGVCVGCDGTGIHPYAGRGWPGDENYVGPDEPCSWCEGTRICSADPSHILQKAQKEVSP